MKFARKLIFAIVLVVSVVLTAYGYFRVQRDLETFEADMRRDHEVLGQALSHIVASSWKREGRERALELLAAAARKQGTTIRWLDRSQPVAATAGDVRDSFFRVVSGDEDLGTIQISESRAEERAHVRDTVWRTVEFTVALGLLTAGCVAALAIGFVGRPIARLRAKMKRIGAGDLSGPLHLGQRDEIGELAVDLNLMCERLDDARHRLQRETEGRLLALDQLRHADRLATVGTLASGIAHELGTPLSVVLARARLIEDESGSDANALEDTRASARIIAGQVERISAIIRQLLDFARGRAVHVATALRVARAAIDLRLVVESTLKLVQPLADKRAVRLTGVGATEGPVEVEADEALVQQVLLNLVMNALQAMHQPGEVRVTIGQRAERVPSDVALGRATQDVATFAFITVEDEGQGIAAEVLQHIFEPFFTTKGVGEGTGLGLSVSYGIVREHGGWISVDTTIDKGSRFTVHLPGISR